MKSAAAKQNNKDNKDADRDLFRNQFKKTRMCSFFQEGRCRRGDECTFAHTTVETPPDLTKTSLCKRWKEGTCTLSSANCPFAHGKRELRQTALFKHTRRSNGEEGLPVGEQAKAPSCPLVPMPSKLSAQPVAKTCAEAPKPRAAQKTQPAKEQLSEPMKMLEPMKVMPSFCGDLGRDHMPAFLAPPSKITSPWMYPEPWESETATGSTRSTGSDDGSYEGQDWFQDSPILSGYSAFSGMPRFLPGNLQKAAISF